MTRPTRKAAARPGPRRRKTVVDAASGLRAELTVALSVVTGLRRQVEGRDATIRAVEAERDAARAQATELAEALVRACATPPAVVAERDAYRAALAQIEAALHGLGTGCGCAHADGHDEHDV